MLQQIGQLAMGLSHTGLYALLPHREPHRKRVDEQAHPTLAAYPSLHAPQQYRPKNYVLTPRQPCQHHTPKPGGTDSLRLPATLGARARIRRAISASTSGELLESRSHLPARPTAQTEP